MMEGKVCQTPGHLRMPDMRREATAGAPKEAGADCVLWLNAPSCHVGPYGLAAPHFVPAAAPSGPSATEVTRKEGEGEGQVKGEGERVEQTEEREGGEERTSKHRPNSVSPCALRARWQKLRFCPEAAASHQRFSTGLSSNHPTRGPRKGGRESRARGTHGSGTSPGAGRDATPPVR